MATIRQKFDATEIGVSEACSFVEQVLSGYKLEKKSITRTELALEESALKLIAAKNAGNTFEVTIKKRIFQYTVELECSGEEIEFYDKDFIAGKVNYNAENIHTEEAIRNIVINVLGKFLNYSHKRSFNRVIIEAQKVERSLLVLTIWGLIFAIIAGLILKNFAPESIQTMLCTNLFTPFTTIFMNALKMMVVPVVFFSIMTSISQFGDVSEFGKIGGKIIGFFIVSTIISSIIAIFTFNIISPGEYGSYSQSSSVTLDESIKNNVEATKNSVSVVNTIVNIVPNNIVKPYSNSDILQIIFIASLLGVSINLIGDYSIILKNFLEACNQLFMKTTTLIIQLIPLAVFSSITELILKTSINALLSLIGFVLCVLTAFVVIYLLYLFLIWFLARLNPIIFLKKFSSVMLKAFSLGSSSAVIPDNLDSCKKMGVSEKISSFSIPLGSTINMNGTCIYMVIAVLFLGKLCGMTFDMSNYLTIIFSSLMLSVGCPAIPGASLVCMAVLLLQFGIPAESITIIMGIDSIGNMFRTMFNVTGDAVCSVIVAKQENLLDEEVYKDMSKI